MIAELTQTTMNIILADYKEGVITPVQEDYDPHALDMEFVDLKYTKPLHMEGAVEKAVDTLTFRGHLSSEAELTCGRCLQTIKQAVDKDFELFYEIKGKESVDTIDDLRETLILDHNISFVCRENCRGLCPQCGTNLNEAKCACRIQESSISSPLAELKKLWEKKKK